MRIYIVLMMLCFGNLGCDFRERAAELDKKEKEISQKEERLMLFEKQLQIKEEELKQREQYVDTSMYKLLAADSVLITRQFVGSWSVTMRCTETTCDGSAVGDTKKEQWIVEFQSNVIIVKAMADNKLVRLYTGTYTESMLQLSAQQEPSSNSTKMTVRLTYKNEKELEGIREIVRPENCKIVYALSLRKS